MIKIRPYIRYDGFYVCKMMYRRSGLSDHSTNHPVFEVISYKYLKFNPDGTTLSIYTNFTPKRFLPKIKQHIQTFNDKQLHGEGAQG